MYKILTIPIKKEGFELVDISIVKNGSEKILQLFIHCPEGIEMQDCVTVNQITIGILKNFNPILENFTLEISSPGIFRKLDKPEHFEIFKGKRIKVKLLQKMDGTKNLIGNIEECHEKGILLKTTNKNKELLIPFSQITKANLEPELNI